MLGDGRTPTCVVPGSRCRPENGSLALFKRQLAQNASMRAVMLRYAHAFFNQVAQLAACNHFHPIQQRCCRWMLMTHDRIQLDEFRLTQEFLAMMLGVQRTGVSAAAVALQREGPHPLQAWQRHDPRSPRPGAPRVRVLRRYQAGVRSPARRSRNAQRSCATSPRIRPTDADAGHWVSFDATTSRFGVCLRALLVAHSSSNGDHRCPQGRDQGAVEADRGRGSGHGSGAYRAACGSGSRSRDVAASRPMR